MMQMRSRSAVLEFVDEVTLRYGSLDAYFTRLRAELDDEPTVVLPALTDTPTSPTAWAAVARADDEPGAGRPAAQLPQAPVAKGRKGPGALWSRMLGRS
ncbi:hypothetical protein IU485_02965 [Nocardia cyriacigeorgica]|uniref:Uncharacterized protein n=2 Tax=Nocardia cyriacigeorgica TaxID=135487 RepID=H6RCE8_NOCCG|nr:hypothetical protein [Nocardia cyriacigeorgica]MBF6080311.1 hypothetical protein [Nocardia cyriacigeorgica]BDT87542.1 hypothetical protein FMUAM8_33060 [Nocardia cyriacigeorgica]BDU06935.1 hypothetical protein FMUBM48_31980 [Nocardia cyriacigeorgica]CCF63888.1 protein of unknown function [Nocardia cyriacigeorgica GUH-2]